MDLVVEKEKGRVLKLDSLSRTEHWKGVDILIFNSYHWWIHTGRSQTYVRVAFFFLVFCILSIYESFLDYAGGITSKLETK